MDSFEINKILGALLGTCLVLLAVHMASGAIFTPPAPIKPGYVIKVKEEQPTVPSGGSAPAVAQADFDKLLASASVKRGAEVAKQCQLCHNLGKGEGAKIGPDLYGVVGRPVASQPGFNYTAALKAKGGDWSFAALDKWLTNPRADVPGTAMTFAGIDNVAQRAEVIAFLNSNSDKPLPLPKAAQNKSAPGSASANAAKAPAAPVASKSATPAAGPASAPAAAPQPKAGSAEPK